MNREILFKAKRIDNGEWKQGFFCTVHERNVITQDIYALAYEGINDDSYDEVDENTLCQFTGLLDKNGNKIFEGDIIKVPNNYSVFGKNAGETYEIYFGYGGFRMKPKYNKNSKGFYLEDDKTYKIIGNIHDSEV